MASDEVVDHPYRKPGVPGARILHERVSIYLTENEWNAVAKAAGHPNLVESWVYTAVMEALGDEPSSSNVDVDRILDEIAHATAQYQADIARHIEKLRIVQSEEKNR